MKFIHISDVHLGAEPDVGSVYSRVRPQELWDTFEGVLSVCEQEQIDLLLIAGDLFHRQPLLRELKEVDYLFSSLSHTKVVFVAGNHDYVAAGSYYRSFSWGENVYPLLGSEPEHVLFQDLDTAVYGFSYDSREIREPRYDTVRARKAAKYEILLAHGGDEKHIPIRRNMLETSEFDYIALGHIHKPQEIIPGKAAYAGALEPIDKNDIGKHGYIYGEIQNHHLKTEFIPFAKREYLHLVLEVRADMTVGSLRTWIRQVIEKRGKENLYQFTLKGFRDADIEILPEQLCVSENILGITDQTKAAYDLERLKWEQRDNLIGRYIELFEECEEGSIEEMALYEGVRALMESR